MSQNPSQSDALLSLIAELARDRAAFSAENQQLRIELARVHMQLAAKDGQPGAAETEA